MPRYIDTEHEQGDGVDRAVVALVLVFVVVVVVVDLKNFDAIVDGSDFDVSVVLALKQE